MAKIQKPEWTPAQLRENYLRWEKLIHETEAHESDCLCNTCMECYALRELVMTFSDDEHAAAVRTEIESAEVNNELD